MGKVNRKPIRPTILRLLEDDIKKERQREFWTDVAQALLILIIAAFLGWLCLHT